MYFTFIIFLNGIFPLRQKFINPCKYNIIGSHVTKTCTCKFSVVSSGAQMIPFALRMMGSFPRQKAVPCALSAAVSGHNKEKLLYRKNGVPQQGGAL